MYFDDNIYHVEFRNSLEKRDVTLSGLGNHIINFLEYYGGEYLLGRQFCDLIGDGDGATRFQSLLRATGYTGNPDGFFSEVIEKIAAAGSQEGEPLKINSVVLPHLLVVAILEIIIPGNTFVTIKDVSQLERLTNIVVPDGDRADLQNVIDTYPARLSMHTIRQMRRSKAVAYQYLPFIEELDPVGQMNTWIGQFHQGPLEQMYQNRVIFLLNMSCPVYCRFCFRKHKDSRNQSNPTENDVKKAVEHVKNSPGIKEILITGGDPFLNKANMACAIDGLKEISHVQTLRLATRSISYYPHLFYADNCFWLNYLKMKNLELQQVGKRIEIATHFIHPDEISLESLDIISEFVKNGMAVYVQTPFLKDCNGEGPELTKLFHLLRGAGAELHYIFIPCSPIHGNSIYGTPISKGLEAANYLRAHLSDRIIPRLCTATPIGKIDWHSSGWAVEQDRENDHFIWIRTPYTPDYFKAFAPLANAMDVVRVNKEGTLDARFRAQIGNETLFWGSREPQTPKNQETDQGALKDMQNLVLQDQRIAVSIVATATSNLFRSHATRVEIDPEAGDQVSDYIEREKKITDVVIASKQDAIENLYRIGHVIKKLRDIHHVNAVRLRSLKFNYAPEIYTRAVIDKLGDLNRLTIADPLRLEIETQFLHSNEIKPQHGKLARALNNRGITVYNNTPLLFNINDTAAEVHRIAYGCRRAGIEFHHIYVAGLPFQKAYNEHHPVDIADVIDIATGVRKDGSGREIPRYIILTELGEVDFGLTSKIIGPNDKLSLKLLPYDLAYFKGMDPDYDWPEHIKIDTDGKPVIPVTGLKNSSNFFI